MSGELKDMRVGIALTGSFCTFHKLFEALPALREAGAILQPILSNHVYTMDTRFYRAEEVRRRMEDICENPCWHTIEQVEPIGPKKLLDLLIVAPCTGNTLGKLAGGIADTPVTMACKSQLRNARPVLLGISTNDGLAASAQNIGMLMNRKHVYFIPFYQDDPVNKPTSLLMDVEELIHAAEAAMRQEQLQPLLRMMSI